MSLLPFFLSQVVFAAQPKLLQTPAQNIGCPTGVEKKHPLVLSDVNQDGKFEHIGVTKKEQLFIVTMYTAGDLAPLSSWTFSGEEIAVSTTRRRGTPSGDLWVDVKRGEQRWLYHLSEGSLSPMFTKAFRYDLRFDLDGDGIIDPLADSAQGVVAIVAGKQHRIPSLPSTIGLFGEKVGYGQEDPIDIDKNGNKALFYSENNSFYLFRLNTLKKEPKPFGQGLHPRLLNWKNQLAVISLVNSVPHVWSLEKPFGLLTAYVEHKSILPVTNLMLPKPYIAMNQGWLIDSNSPKEVLFGNFIWARPAEDHPMNPLPFQAEKNAAWIGVRGVSFAGSNKSEIVEINPLSKDNPVQRVIFKKNHHSDVYKMKPFVTDINGDGIGEILVGETSYGKLGEKSASYEKSRWFILNGAGDILWADKFRRSKVPFKNNSGMAYPRVIEWSGEGQYAIQFRTDKTVFYVLPTTLKHPKTIPLCLE